jgi:type I restriction enzyme S subunit
MTLSQESVAQLLKELKSGLRALYGSRLRQVYLYGSYARGDQDTESDLDILIVLSDYNHYGEEIDRTSLLTSQLSLKYNISISTVFLRWRDWREADTPLLRNVRAEAIQA